LKNKTTKDESAIHQLIYTKGEQNMKTVKGHLRCTKTEEVLERITSESIRELYDIENKIDEERKTGFVTSARLRWDWSDKYCVEPYEINRNSLSFLITGKTVYKIVYDFDENFNIIDVNTFIM
jgi:hypothetical protein